jgi:repressor LexA
MAYLHPENPDFSVIKVDMKKQPLDIEGIAVGVLRHL